MGWLYEYEYSFVISSNDNQQIKFDLELPDAGLVDIYEYNHHFRPIQFDYGDIFKYVLDHIDSDECLRRYVSSRPSENYRYKAENYSIPGDQSEFYHSKLWSDFGFKVTSNFKISKIVKTLYLRHDNNGSNYLELFFNFDTQNVYRSIVYDIWNRLDYLLYDYMDNDYPSHMEHLMYLYETLNGNELEQAVRLYLNELTDSEQWREMPEDVVDDVIIIINNEENLYNGEYCNGKRDGCGKSFTKLEGILKYDGEWKDNLYHGHGTLYYLNGNIEYEGSFKNGKREWQGTSYYSEGGIQYQGIWMNDKPYVQEKTQINNHSSVIQMKKLAYKEGSSDKVYYVFLVNEDHGFLVNFEFGKRGTKLQTGTKTPTNVDEGTAHKIFDKIVQEKLSKGYYEELLN